MATSAELRVCINNVMWFPFSFTFQNSLSMENFEWLIYVARLTNPYAYPCLLEAQHLHLVSFHYFQNKIHYLAFRMNALISLYDANIYENTLIPNFSKVTRRISLLPVSQFVDLENSMHPHKKKNLFLFITNIYSCSLQICNHLNIL